MKQIYYNGEVYYISGSRMFVVRAGKPQYVTDYTRMIKDNKTVQNIAIEVEELTKENDYAQSCYNQSAKILRKWFISSKQSKQATELFEEYTRWNCQDELDKAKKLLDEHNWLYEIIRTTPKQH